ncbi:MAG: leucine--tRNA ligase [Alphaproteobacteria bacterium]|nr:leucine--tRNA ligase [Alphaproteobacteria bacterium]MCB9695322.1 leucine--tRNA ligase [Alphaproteobacteria bacterium]
MAGYDHTAIETKWRDTWERERTFATPTDRSKPKYYVLDMFPYPSGDGLHVGHPKGYVATDVVARARRMMGFNVLRVMGWDSFGLPAERQAVKEGIHPRAVTVRNVARFKSQLSNLGLSYDWDYELATSDVKYYRWTQWIFLKLFERGLAYQAEVPVNWCPALGTVLANEEVKDGKYVETGDPVEKRMMKQWMLRITAYAERLVDDLEAVDWPEGIKQMQRDWIGRSEGAEVRFEVDGHDASFEVFTTRPDTLFGCTYAVLAPEHALVDAITTDAQRGAVAAYREQVSKVAERDRLAQAADAPKTGVFTGAYAICPVNGQKVPIWIADYVLAGYGTGAVFACPAHDERDHAFARTFDLPIVEVVSGGDVQAAAYTGDGPHVNSGFMDGLDIDGAKKRVIAWLEEHGRGRGTVQYRLRDWLFSRQRYWGEPFPLVHTPDGRVVPVREEDLPVRLPELDDYRPTEDGQPPLARAQDWVHTTLPDGTPATRETNTMPQWAGSCWYYLRFVSPHDEGAAWEADAEHYWMPVDLYVGGAEHAVLHLLYARFWHKVLYDLGLVSTKEPFQRLFNQGMVHAMSFNDSADGRGRFYYPYQVEQRDGDWVAKDDGRPVHTKVMKMSKSRYNVTNPDDVCTRHGADALRLYELFMGPLEDGAMWEDAGVAGTRRFLDKVVRLMELPRDESFVDKAADRALHGAIKKVTEAVESLRFNTAISDMMIATNELTRAGTVRTDQLEALVRILAPFAPHLAEELWEGLGHRGGISFVAWPEVDEAKLAVDTVTIAVQVNGKLRGNIHVAPDADKDSVLAAARAESSVAKYLDGVTIRREVVVPGRLVNFVVG